jgi:hypothetical protein
MKHKPNNKNAMKLYNHYLKKVVYPKTGRKTTFLSQINGAGKALLGVKFKGVYPSDKLPKLNDLSPYCILNLDKSTEPGSHWIALAKIENGQSIVYDSFGRNYKKIIPNLNYSGNGKIINTDDDSEQKMTETNCGARCIAFLMVLDNYGTEMAMKI